MQAKLVKSKALDAVPTERSAKRETRSEQRFTCCKGWDIESFTASDERGDLILKIADEVSYMFYCSGCYKTTYMCKLCECVIYESDSSNLIVNIAAHTVRKHNNLCTLANAGELYVRAHANGEWTEITSLIEYIPALAVMKMLYSFDNILDHIKNEMSYSVECDFKYKFGADKTLIYEINTELINRIIELNHSCLICGLAFDSFPTYEILNLHYKSH